MTGKKIFLRPLEPGDLDYLYRWENDPEVWKFGDCGADDSRIESRSAEVSGAQVPRMPSGMRSLPTHERFTREELRKFIENQQHGIHANEQLRFVICRRNPSSTTPGSPVGFIDLFDFDPEKLTAGVGILICDPADRRRGYGHEAMELTLEWARREPGLREMWCTVAADNPVSLALFTGVGFVPAETESTKKLLTFSQELSTLLPLPLRRRALFDF